MKKYKNFVISCSVILAIIAMFTYSLTKMKEETILTSVSENSASSLSNKKIGWGIKREKNHNQPDVGSVNKSLLDRYDGYCLGNKDKKYLYLTFDEGYEAGYTPQLLEALKKNEVKATFFITAHYLNTQEELVKRMIEEGHIVGNHTVNHKSMPDLSDEQIREEVMKLHQAIYEKTGYEMKYIRPPKGEYSERTLHLCNNLGYKTVMWSFAYMDWDEKHQKGNEYATKMILDNLHNGSILLLHGNSKNNADVLDRVIQEAKAQGYEFKSLDEFEK